MNKQSSLFETKERKAHSAPADRFVEVRGYRIPIRFCGPNGEPHVTAKAFAALIGVTDSTIHRLTKGADVALIYDPAMRRSYRAFALASVLARLEFRDEQTRENRDRFVQVVYRKLYGDAPAPEEAEPEEPAKVPAVPPEEIDELNLVSTVEAIRKYLVDALERLEKVEERVEGTRSLVDAVMGSYSSWTGRIKDLEDRCKNLENDRLNTKNNAVRAVAVTESIERAVADMQQDITAMRESLPDIKGALRCLRVIQ
ncbi:MAG: hypothetical protein RBS34_15410 [Desulfofustis sp.]|jgi:hypothetical protein|nr:hypothetical protein [Desulfofustis sp.]